VNQDSLKIDIVQEDTLANVVLADTLAIKTVKDSVVRFITPDSSQSDSISFHEIQPENSADSVKKQILSPPHPEMIRRSMEADKTDGSTTKAEVPDTTLQQVIDLQYEINLKFPAQAEGIYEQSMKPARSRVFIYTESGEKTTNDMTGLTANHKVKSNHDWLLALIILIFILLARMRLLFGKFIVPILNSGINSQTLQNLYRNRNSLYFQAGFNLDLIFFLSTGLYLFQLLEFSDPEPWKLRGLISYAVVVVLLGGWLLLKYLVHKAVGLISANKALFNENFHAVLIYNKIAGLLLIPVVLGLAYVHPSLASIFLFSGLGLLLIIYFLRIIRLNTLFISKRISPLYSILYLCALEILPVLVLIRVFFPLN